MLLAELQQQLFYFFGMSGCLLQICCLRCKAETSGIQTTTSGLTVRRRGAKREGGGMFMPDDSCNPCIMMTELDEQTSLGTPAAARWLP